METDKSLSPLERGLSAAWLKYFAAFFMLVDHTDALFHLLDGVTPPGHWSFYLLRILGRMSFPIFLFFVAEGCRRTHDLGGYLKRLLIFSLVAQIPFSLVFGILGFSVIFSFFLGVLGVWCYERLKSVQPILAVLPGLALALIGELLDTDYGWFGAAMVLLLYLCGERRTLRLLLLGGGFVFLYLVQVPVENLLLWVPDGSTFLSALPQILLPYLEVWLPYHLFSTFAALIPVGLLAFYHGERGRGNKWFFYWFYPVHLLVLLGLNLVLGW